MTKPFWEGLEGWLVHYAQASWWLRVKGVVFSEDISCESPVWVNFQCHWQNWLPVNSTNSIVTFIIHLGSYPKNFKLVR